VLPAAAAVGCGGSPAAGLLPTLMRSLGVMGAGGASAAAAQQRNSSTKGQSHGLQLIAVHRSASMHSQQTLLSDVLPCLCCRACLDSCCESSVRNAALTE
jgi:hypothetical protein